jgi:hypothetical protein
MICTKKNWINSFTLITGALLVLKQKFQTPEISGAQSLESAPSLWSVTWMETSMLLKMYVLTEVCAFAEKEKETQETSFVPIINGTTA